MNVLPQCMYFLCSDPQQSHVVPVLRVLLVLLLVAPPSLGIYPLLSLVHMDKQLYSGEHHVTMRATAGHLLVTGIRGNSDRHVNDMLSETC
jgi:hypothetical protein